MHAERCPVCNGAGEIDNNNPSGASIETRLCHGCNGRGWIEVMDGSGFYELYEFHRDGNYWTVK